MATRDTILECARDIYLDEGLSALSMRAVARRAGVSAPAIYRHFENKEDLLWAICQRGHELFGRYLARGLRASDPRERLVATGLGYLDFALEHRRYYLVMFVAPPEQLGFERLARRNDGEGAVTFQMLVDRVRECIDAGVLSRRDPLEHAVAIWAYVHGLVTLYYRAPQGDAPAEVPPVLRTPDGFRAFYRRSIEALIAGLAP